MLSSPPSSFQAHLKNIFLMAAPALHQTGKPEEYVQGVYLRLLELIKQATHNKTLFQQIVPHSHKAFGLKTTEQQKRFDEIFTLLAEQIIKLSTEQSTATKELITSIFKPDEVIRGLYEAIEVYKENIKPPVLAARQKVYQEMINKHPVVADAKRRITAREKDNRTSYDFLIYTSNQGYQIPGGYKLYEKNGWCPPQQFVDEIMHGGPMYLARQGYLGSGGYIAGNEMSFQMLERIKQNTFAGRLYSSVNPDHPHYKCFRLGYLFGIRTPDGKEYDIDSHGMEKTLSYGEGSLVNYGPVKYQGKVVTEAFWNRVTSLIELRLANEEKAWEIATGLGMLRNYGVFTQLTLPAFKQDVKDDISTLPVTHVTNLPKREVEIANGSRSFAQSGRYALDPTVIKYLEVLTQAKKVSAYKGPPVKAKIEILPREAGQLTSHDYKAEVAYCGLVDNFGDEDPEQKYYTDLGNARASCLELERALGRQGTFIDRSIAFCHTKLEFASGADLEAAVDLLTIPGQEIILPFDVMVKGNIIYLQGPIDVARLMQRLYLKKEADAKTPAAKKTPSNPLVEDVKNSDATSQGVMPMSGTKPADKPSTALVLPKVAENAEATLVQAIIPQSLRDKFQVSYSNATNQCQIALNLRDKTVSVAGQKVVTQITTEAFQTLEFIAKDAKVDMKLESKDEKVMAIVPAQSLQTLTTAIANGVNNERLVATVAVELHAADTLMKRAATLHLSEVKEDPKLQELAILSDWLLPLADLQQHRLDVIDRALLSQLKKAVRENNLSDVKELVRIGADPNQVVGMAAGEDKVNVETLSCLMDFKVNPEGYRSARERRDNDDRYFETPLYRAVSQGSLAKVQLLVKHGADMARLHSNDTPLVTAAFGGNSAIAEWLLEQGGVHIVDRYGRKEKDVDQALMYLHRFKEEKSALSFLNELVAKGANVNYSGGLRSPLANVLNQKLSFDPPLVKRFIELKAKLFMKDLVEWLRAQENKVALLFDKIQKDKELIKILPDLNEQDDEGNTYLHHFLNQIYHTLNRFKDYFIEDCTNRVEIEKKKIINYFNSILLITEYWPIAEQKINLQHTNSEGKSIKNLLDDLNKLCTKESTKPSLTFFAKMDEYEKLLKFFQPQVEAIKEKILKRAQAELTVAAKK